MSGALRARLFEAVALGVFMANMLGRKGEGRPPVVVATVELCVGQPHPNSRHPYSEHHESYYLALTETYFRAGGVRDAT
jgi:hypothetical protein